MYQIQDEEGRVLPQGGNFIYEFDLKDHLGNTRVSFKANGGVLEKVAETSFDPWGVVLRGAGQVNTAQNRWEMQGKEKESTFGLNRINLGARTYNPTTGRMDKIDRFSEKYNRFSPYSYAAGNPVRFIDVNGDSISIDKSLTNDKTALKAFNSFANTKQGIKFLAKYAGQGQNIGGHKYPKNGEYHKSGINLTYKSANISDPETKGTTGNSEGNITVTIDNDANKDISSRIITLFHESFIHAENTALDFMDNGKNDNSNLGLTNSQKSGYRESHFQHIKVRDDFLKYQYKSPNLWPGAAMEGIIEANKIINKNYPATYILKTMWNYEGGIEFKD